MSDPAITPEAVEVPPADQGTLDGRTAEVLTRIYGSRRIEYQLGYYQKRAQEYETSADFLFRFGALIMTVSSLLAALSTLSDARPELRLATALLPAFAALIASFRQLYQWDRQAALYRDSMLGLERVRLLVPDGDDLDAMKALRVYPQIVARSEKVFQDEVNQWGQIALGKEEEGKEDVDPVRTFALEYGLDIFTEDGQVDEDRVALVRDILRATEGSSTPLASLTLDYPSGQLSATASAASEDDAPESDPPAPTADPGGAEADDNDSKQIDQG